MSRFNELYRGELPDAIAQLEDQEASEDELRAALINAMQRIGRLEARIEKLEKRSDCGCEPDALNPGCPQHGTAEERGTYGEGPL